VAARRARAHDPQRRRALVSHHASSHLLKRKACLLRSPAPGDRTWPPVRANPPWNRRSARRWSAAGTRWRPARARRGSAFRGWSSKQMSRGWLGSASGVSGTLGSSSTSSGSGSSCRRSAVTASWRASGEGGRRQARCAGRPARKSRASAASAAGPPALADCGRAEPEATRSGDSMKHQLDGDQSHGRRGTGRGGRSVHASSASASFWSKSKRIRSGWSFSHCLA
jgi:hypothetical protein